MHRDFLKIALAGLLLVSAPLLAENRAPAYSVTPILFIPNPASFPVGYQPTEAILQEDLVNIAAVMEYVRQWYGDALGLDTSLDVQPVVRLDAWFGLSAYEIYWDDPTRRYSDGISLGNTWDLVLSEVGARGYTAGTSAAPRLNVIFCKGAGGFAGGAQWHNDPGGGNCMLGDWCLDALAGRIPPEDYVWWWSDASDQRGATAHEMGHCWGLAHPDDVTNPVTGVYDKAYTVMYNFWDFPNYPTNPADPTWPLRGLHAWANDLGPGGTRYEGYQDVHMLDYRAAWFVTPRWAPADLNRDGDVDDADTALFAVCLSGPGVSTPPAGCDTAAFARADIEGDDDVDLGDFAEYVILFNEW